MCLTNQRIKKPKKKIRLSFLHRDVEKKRRPEKSKFGGEKLSGKPILSIFLSPGTEGGGVGWRREDI